MGVGAAILGASAIGGAASLASGLIGSNAASKAAGEQATAAQNALNTQVSAENTSLAALAPYNQVGTGATNSLANLYGIAYNATGSAAPTTSSTGVVTPGNVNATVSSAGGQSAINAAMTNFTKSPDYQFAFQQGMQALDRSAAASGNLQSGGQVKAAQQYGQGLASQQFGNYYNRLLSLANIGQSAAAGTASNSLNAGNSQANSQQAIGQAQASGTVGSANALSSALTGGAGSVTTPLLLSALSGNLGGANNLMSAYSTNVNNYLGTENQTSGLLSSLGIGS